MAVGFGLVDESEKNEKVPKRIPIGYRFAPNDVELTTIYLWNKVHELPIPGLAIPDLNAALFYAMSPSFLAGHFKEERRKRSWSAGTLYFFLRKGNGMNARRDSELDDGKENGQWEFIEEKSVKNTNGQEVAIKAKSVYMNENGKKTCCSMEEYRLSNKISANTNQWVMVKINLNSENVKNNRVKDDVLAVIHA